ncbi:MAG: hypothetical protein L0207_02455 [Chlamydiae bacterium]|nr:hypothetical protein [Chlamydiota bacterium]
MIILIYLLIQIFFSSIIVHAQEFIVTSLNDSGSNTLREALNNAAANDVITFDSSLSGTILLQSSLPSITANLSIFGPPSRAVTIDGDSIYHVFTVTGGTVTIHDLNVQDSNSSVAGSALLVSTGTDVSLSHFSFCHCNTEVNVGAVSVEQDGMVTAHNTSFSRVPPNVGLDIFFEDGSGTILSSDLPGISHMEIDGASNIFKRGPGTISLSLATIPTIALDIVVDEGELILDGSLGEPVIVNPLGALKGTPTLSDLVNSGAVRPGLPIGTMVVAGDYVQTPTGRLEIEIQPPGSTDLLEVGNMLLSMVLFSLFLLLECILKERNFSFSQQEAL